MNLAQSETNQAMTNEQLIEQLTSANPDAVVKQGSQYPEITVAHDKLHAFMQNIKSDSSLHSITWFAKPELITRNLYR